MIGNWFQNRDNQDAIPESYFARPELEDAFGRALRHRQHVLVYGAPRQGKTALVKHALKDRPHVVQRASSETTFANISRNYLLAIGCSVVIEQARRRKLGTKADVKFKVPLVTEASIGANAGDEVEERRSISTDISDPNDICHLLREFKDPPLLVIDRFEQLRRKQRRLVLDFLDVCAEANVLHVVVIAASLDPPLDHRERIAHGRNISLVLVPPLSRAESGKLITSVLAGLDTSQLPRIADTAHEICQGSIELTLEACSILDSKIRTHQGGGQANEPGQLRNLFTSALREQLRSHYLNLLTAICERGWGINVVKLVSRARRVTSPDGNAVVKSAAFRELQNEISEHQANRSNLAHLDPVARKRMAPLVSQAIRFSNHLMRTGVDLESTRMLAYSLQQLIRAPTAPYIPSYERSYGKRGMELTYGKLMCTLLLEADLTKTVVLNDAAISAHLESSGYRPIRSDADTPVIERIARRIRRLQRRLRVHPPLFVVNDALTEIVLWPAEYWTVIGDIKKDLEEILEREDFDDELV